MIDDDTKLCALVHDFLAPYGMEVSFAHEGNAGLKRALTERFDALLLDMMLPGLDGLSILKEIRAQRRNLPVVVISVQGDVSDKIVGLELGADDYVPKTFEPRELLARLRAVIRRVQPSPAQEEAGGEEPVVSVHGLVLDNSRMEASLDDRPLELSTIEFRLLYLLASRPGRVFSRERLLEAISGREYYGLDRSIDMHISSLRRKLGDSPRSPSYLRTVRGSGYMFLR